jgi:membrane glycosyltransferase
MNTHTDVPAQAVPGMPPVEARVMPTQDLRAAPRGDWGARPISPQNFRIYAARLIVFGGTAALAAFGAEEMITVVSAGGITQFEALFTALFVINFTWIAFAAASAVAGLLVPLPPQLGLDPAKRLATRTALVMPVYHESAAATAAALEVMAHGLADRCQAHAFEIVILSDSRSAESWVAETQAVEALRKRLAGVMPVWYRRRWSNAGRKAGNIREFVERWGGRYDHLVILDADSLIAPDTLIALAAAMENDPGLGLRQTAPSLAGSATLYGRLQQFANRIFGPVVTRGLAAWSGADGNYWGHNAIIRTEAFAACCGLPHLRGAPPLGGPIMSHDFVEAALLRRAGWRVEMATNLEGSWEGSPPSLLDTAARDRRWAQGNLQHTKVITARGLAWPSRLHLAVGVMSYLASPLWLLLIACGIVLTVQADVIRPEYFPKSHQLFPSWPLFDAERMTRLFVFTLGILLFPKALGLVLALARRELRQGAGGVIRLIASASVELLLSGLYAPVMMAIHTAHVTNIFLGRDGGWNAQRRADGSTSWGEAWRKHRHHMAVGVAAAVGAWFVSPPLLAWLSPMLAGFFLVVPLSYASGSARIGGLLRKAGLLLTPEETRPHQLLRARDLAERRYPGLGGDEILILATNPHAREAHLGLANPHPRRRGAPEPAVLTAAAKIADARSMDEVLAWLSPAERVHIASDRKLLEALAALPAPTAPPLAANPAPRPLLPTPALQPLRDQVPAVESAAV